MVSGMWDVGLPVLDAQEPFLLIVFQGFESTLDKEVVRSYNNVIKLDSIK